MYPPCLVGFVFFDSKIALKNIENTKNFHFLYIELLKPKFQKDLTKVFLYFLYFLMYFILLLLYIYI